MKRPRKRTDFRITELLSGAGYRHFRRTHMSDCDAASRFGNQLLEGEALLLEFTTQSPWREAALIGDHVEPEGPGAERQFHCVTGSIQHVDRVIAKLQRLLQLHGGKAHKGVI